MDENHIKMLEMTVKYLEFVTPLFLIILSASGVAFYYYWTNKAKHLKIKNLWPFALPAAVVLAALFFIAHLYSRVIDSFGEGLISSYMLFWFNWVGWLLWLGLFGGIVLLVIAFLMLDRKA